MEEENVKKEECGKWLRRTIEHSLDLLLFLDSGAPRSSSLSFGICGCRDEGSETPIFHGRGSGTYGRSGMEEVELISKNISNMHGWV